MLFCYLESLQIVNENVRKPEIVDQLEVDRYHRLRRDDRVVELGQKAFGDSKSRLLPQHVEV